jgi:8-oxo-dGDP phosphatase
MSDETCPSSTAAHALHAPCPVTANLSASSNAGGGDPLPRAECAAIRTLASRVAYETPWLRVHQDVVERQDGSRGTFGYVAFPYPIAVIAAVDAERRICLVRQWRYPWGRDSWELPAGRCEAGEAPEDGARRELREEAGVEARLLQPLSTFYASASIATQFHLFLATGLTPVASRRDHEEQDMVAAWVSLADAARAALDGRIVHSATIAAILRLDRELS